MPTVIIPPTDVSPNTGTGSEVLSNAPTLVNPIITGTIDVSGNITAADLILGTSGPSVKSTLSARAPRQGLVFDSSHGTTYATVANIPAFGQGVAGSTSGDFTFAAWVREESSFAGTPIVVIGNAAGGFYCEFNSSGVPYVGVQGGSILLSTATCVVGKTYLLTYTRTGNTGTWYIDGVATNSLTDGINYTHPFANVSFASPYGLHGFCYPLAYNRCLSATEVKALYEAGAPAGADYNSASNTSVNATFSNVLYDTFSGASATGFTAVRSSNALADADAVISQSWQVGAKFLVTFNATLTSGVAPVVRLAKFGVATLSANSTVVGGANSIVLTATTASSGTCGVEFETIGVTSYAISNFSIKPLGLLLAPDAAQAGGGLVWYDTSGNAANITLPASGVSWNVPSSRVLGGNWTTSGTLGVNKVAGGEASVASTLQITSPAVSETGAGGLEWKADVANNGYGFRTLPVFNGVSSYDLYTQSRSNSASWTTRTSLTNSGNLLIGGTVDNSLGKLQVSGNAVVTSAIPRIYLNRNGGYVWSVLQSDGTGSLGDISTLNFVNNGNVSKFSLTDAGDATFAGDLTNYKQRILRGPSSNNDASLVPVINEFGKSSGNVATTTATVVITGTVGGAATWREGLIEVYAAGVNAYSGGEGGINELVYFQHDSGTGLNPRNFTVIRTNSAGSAITITYAGTSPTTFTITVSKTDGSVPGTVPTHEVFAYVRVINSNAISLS